VVGVILSLSLPACKTLESSRGDRSGRPGLKNGYLTAKVAAFLHAMENMPTESKRYGEEFYYASGIADADPAHAKVLVAALAGMHPPVVDAKKIYTRNENSQWMDGKPAIIWTSKVQRVDEDNHAFIIVGWMHSNLLYEFFEYETRHIRADDSWEVVDYVPVGQLER
jgi:hypothetical protein